MAQITIPKELQLGFSELIELEKEQAQELIAALGEIHATRNRPGLRRSVASRVERIERQELEEIVNALISLSGLRNSLESSLSDFVSIVSEAVKESTLEGLEFSGEGRRKAFESLLAEILSIENFEISAKAISLVYEQDHVVHGDFRVLTDLRPIFGSDPHDTSTLAAMVTQTLRFQYHEGDEVKELFAALNANQVDELIEVLERAKAKAESLEQSLENTPIRYVHPD